MMVTTIHTCVRMARGGVGLKGNADKSSLEQVEEGGGKSQEDKEGAEESHESFLDAPGGRRT